MGPDSDQLPQIAPKSLAGRTASTPTRWTILHFLIDGPSFFD
jgi:hypothetical protein